MNARGPAAGRPIPDLSDKQARNFWAKVSLPDAETGCMGWLAAKNPDGYGVVWVGKATYYAHRVAFTAAYGEIPAGHVIDHSGACANKSCVRPDHLRAVTQRENLLAPDGAAYAESIKTHCPAGHDYDDENTYVYRGSRACRTCQRERNRARWLAKKLGVAA